MIVFLVGLLLLLLLQIPGTAIRLGDDSATSIVKASAVLSSLFDKNGEKRCAKSLDDHERLHPSKISGETILPVQPPSTSPLQSTH
jgi:hypothetical protein